MPPGLRKTNVPANVRQKALAVTDGWVGMPTDLPAMAPYFPDTLAASPFTTYVFGFRDVTDLDRTQVEAQAGKAQISAPLLEISVGQELWVTLSNLGLLTRPDLVDSHTLHWHGFRNAIPFYDGVPETSISVPIGRDFTYVYRPQDAGTYMYHCHFEDVEHVTMGMTGIIFVRPAGHPKWAYDDSTTAFDREYALMLTDMDLAGHWNDAHIQTSDWTDYRPDVWLINGRAYPDTLEDSYNPLHTYPAGSTQDRLKYQPQGSRIEAHPGEIVLLRVAHLGSVRHTITVDGVPLHVVGADASQLKNPDGSDNSYWTNGIDLGPGESRDVLFTAPGVGEYLIYDRNVQNLTNNGGAGYGGMLTKLIVKPANEPITAQTVV